MRPKCAINVPVCQPHLSLNSASSRGKDLFSTPRGGSVKEFAYCFYLADSPAGLIVTGEEISGYVLKKIIITCEQRLM